MNGPRYGYRGLLGGIQWIRAYLDAPDCSRVTLEGGCDPEAPDVPILLVTVEARRGQGVSLALTAAEADALATSLEGTVQSLGKAGFHADNLASLAEGLRLGAQRLNASLH